MNRNLRLVIELIENSADGKIAKLKIIKELSLNDKQAEGILGMPLRRLTSLETTKLYKESEELSKT